MTDFQLPKFPEPSWRDTVKLPSFPSIKENVEADVGIVGGGITGITAAYLLSKQNKKVVLLDAGELLNGTTGHTTAKITAQHGLIYDEFISHFGIEKASLYYEAATEAKKFIEETVSELGIECDFNQEDAYIYTNSDSYILQLQKEKKAYDEIGIKSELVDEIPLNIPVKSALIMKNQAQFHPLKFLKALVEACVKNGVQFFENTTAVDIEYNKEPAILTREGKRITCNHIIVASHFPFYDKQSFYFSRMYPERSYVVAVTSDEKYPGGMYINAESPTRSIRSTKDDGKELWLIGGENHKTGQGKSTMDHYEALQKFAEDHFHVQQMEYRWSAQDLTTLDKMPYIGPITENEEAVLVATGFRKWGMTNGTIAAKVLTDRILNEENKYQELYSPSRFQADPAVKKFMEINADVAKHLIKGKLEYTGSNIDNLKADDATVIRVKGKRTGVYKDSEEKLHMVDTTCTHLGCEVKWNSGDRTWDCPCHGSRFSYTGDVIEGPAKKPLPKREIN
ncbi:FAD-dependent oxidoreductase [Oceanobacillus halophilus]|uniref:FAD-dependent oxidoreductase n=1 Tax=Oceanobacillus halophilus TaxID=930130 RepID=A0A495ACC2_9BACI|nr:FAD-dependent oxidoreductase [Oceanobacillus halophilus]RKQ37598.1 FAD-dependent oxidoreductase [Oceanobacillus halophilus]